MSLPAVVVAQSPLGLQDPAMGLCVDDVIGISAQCGNSKHRFHLWECMFQ